MLPNLLFLNELQENSPVIEKLASKMTVQMSSALQLC